MRLMVLALSLVTGLANVACAGFELQVNYNGLAPGGATSFTASAANTPITLDLFLVGTGIDNTPFQVGGASFGLANSGGSVVSQSVTPGFNWTPSASGFGNLGAGSSGSATLTSASFFNSFSPLDPLPQVVNSTSSAAGAYVKVGQFVVTPNQNGQATTYNWQDTFSGDNFFVQSQANPGVNLILGDAATAAVFASSRSFTAVPEPSSVCLLAMFGAGATLVRRRRA